MIQLHITSFTGSVVDVVGSVPWKAWSRRLSTWRQLSLCPSAAAICPLSDWDTSLWSHVWVWMADPSGYDSHSTWTHTHTVRHISTKHTQTLKILNKNAELQKSTNKLKSGWLKKRVHLYHVHWISYEAALMDSFYINHQMTMWNMNVVAASNS